MSIVIDKRPICLRPLYAHGTNYMKRVMTIIGVAELFDAIGAFLA